MTKKEETVDLKPKVEKITEEHLDQLQKIVNAINSLQFNIGKIEAQKHTLLHNLSVTQDRVNQLQDTFQKEYGTFDVNINDGTINRAEEKETKDEK